MSSSSKRTAASTTTTTTTAAVSASPAPSPSSQASQSSSASASASAAAAAASEPQLVGEWLLGETLGQGSFGKVRLGRHIRSKDIAAIKIVEKATILDVSEVQRVYSETFILTTLDHRHIIKLYEVLDTAGALYLVTEFAGGGELYQVVAKRGRIEEEEANELFHQIMSGVEYCHRHNIIHRDLKLENILLDKQGRVKIADFGLSNTIKFGQQLDTSCGTPSYICPEQLTDSEFSGAPTDIWSMGIILFAMVCGFLPFEAPTMPELFRKIRKRQFAYPSFVSRECADFIDIMLEVDPHKRATISDLRNHAWYNMNYSPDLLDRIRAIPPVSKQQIQAARAECRAVGASESQQAASSSASSSSQTGGSQSHNNHNSSSSSGTSYTRSAAGTPSSAGRSLVTHEEGEETRVDDDRAARLARLGLSSAGSLSGKAAEHMAAITTLLSPASSLKNVPLLHGSVNNGHGDKDLSSSSSSSPPPPHSSQRGTTISVDSSNVPSLLPNGKPSTPSSGKRGSSGSRRHKLSVNTNDSPSHGGIHSAPNGAHSGGSGGGGGAISPRSAGPLSSAKKRLAARSPRLSRARSTESSASPLARKMLLKSSQSPHRRRHSSLVSTGDNYKASTTSSRAKRPTTAVSSSSSSSSAGVSTSSPVGVSARQRRAHTVSSASPSHLRSKHSHGFASSTASSASKARHRSRPSSPMASSSASASSTSSASAASASLSSASSSKHRSSRLSPSKKSSSKHHLTVNVKGRAGGSSKSPRSAPGYARPRTRPGAFKAKSLPKD